MVVSRIVAAGVAEVEAGGGRRGWWRREARMVEAGK